jgi:hypothetical protein
LIDFCEMYLFRILNGKFRTDMRGEFTVVNKLGNSVIDYLVAFESLINNILDI